jgi:hypothetical protein
MHDFFSLTILWGGGPISSSNFYPHDTRIETTLQQKSAEWRSEALNGVF